MKKRRLGLLIAALVLLLTAAPVLAHANLANSTPPANASLQNAPTEIRLWFTEPVEPSYSSFTLRDSSGNTVKTPASQVDAADGHQMFMPITSLPNGLYTVAWRAVSASDGHSTEGSFAFGIGVAVPNTPAASIDESVAPDGVLIRWLNLISLSLLVGSIGFWMFVWQPAALEDHARVRRRWWRFAGFAWILSGLAALLLLMLQVSTDANTSLIGALSSPALGNVLSGTTYGQLWLARLILWTLFGLALWLSRTRPRLLWIVLAFGAAILLTQSLFSHASAAPDRLAAVANDWLHLISAALWIGGLAAFASALLTLRRESDQTPLTERLVGAFSNYARVALALVIVSGLYAAWLEVGSLEALVNTVYGRALIVKGALLLPLLAVGAVNLIFTHRGLLRGQSIWVGRLRGLVGAELTLMAGILLTVGVLTSGSPARGVEALRDAVPPQHQPYFDMEIVNNQMMHLQIIPGYVGVNQFVVTPFDANANPLTDVSLIRLRFTNLDQNLGESELRPKPTGNGDFTASGANLSTPGHWRIRMTVAQPNQFDIVVDFNATMTLPPPPTFTIPPIPLNERATAAALVGLALLGIGGYFLVQPRRRLISAAGLLILIGLGAGMTVQSAQNLTTAPTVTPTLSGTTNPIPADAASIKAGYTLFTQNCVICHGADGKGDGPVGLTLNPRPADLTKHTVPGLHTDGDLFGWITNGFPNSAMPAWGTRLSDTDRWNLVNYIRTLAQPTK